MQENIMNNKLTVIATVRNESTSIASFIESLLAQSLKPDEIIIVDGASKDGTNEILQQYEINEKIILITEKCNIATGRNIAIKKAKNDLIAVTDAGCNVDKNWLKEIMLAFQSEQNPDVVAGNFQFECLTPFEESVVLATFNPDRDQTEAARYFPSSRSVAFKKSAWETAKGYPEWLYAAEDTLFNIRLRQLGFNFIFAKNAFVTWRPRETWGALAKQRFNFSRGNSRVGIGTNGYITNIKSHGLILLTLLLSFYSPWLAVLAIFPLLSHTKNNLWPQAKRANEKSKIPFIKWRVLLVMEFVRVIGILGFIRGRLDRVIDKSFISQQQNWMQVNTLDDLDPKYHA